MPVSNPSIERFVAEIVHTATVAMATHNDYIGSFSGKRHRHDDLYQISYVLKGEIRVLFGNHCYSALAGDLFFIPSRRWHAFEPGEGQKRFNLLQIKFKTSRRAMQESAKKRQERPLLNQRCFISMRANF